MGVTMAGKDEVAAFIASDDRERAGGEWPAGRLQHFIRKDAMKPKNPDYAVETRRILSEAPFITDLGIEAVSFEPGACETALTLQRRQLQQDGFVHAGVQATIADHTAGAAAATLIGPDEMILSAEFKINLLRAARGERLTCSARVLKPGNQLTVVESEVFCHQGEERKLVSKATVTLAVIRR